MSVCNGSLAWVTQKGYCKHEFVQAPFYGGKALPLPRFSPKNNNKRRKRKEKKRKEKQHLTDMYISKIQAILLNSSTDLKVERFSFCFSPLSPCKSSSLITSCQLYQKEIVLLMLCRRVFLNRM